MHVHFFRQNRSAFFLAAILGLILLLAFLPPHWGTRLGISLGTIAALWAGGSLLSASRRWHIIFGITVAFAFLLQLVSFGTEASIAFRVLQELLLFAVFLLCLWVVLKHALAAPDAPPLDRVLGSICGYFLLALLGANLFALIADLNPEAFHLPQPGDSMDGRTALYYSLITITTQGYGDIVPRSPVARISAGLFGATGTIYLAVILGAMVSSLRSVQRSPDHD